jgi:phage gp45-like
MRIRRLFVTGGDESPQVEDDFGNAITVEQVGQNGFVSIPETDDEVMVIFPYGNNLEGVSVGTISPVKYGLKPGDRLIITNNAMIKLQNDGTITIDSTGTVNITGVTVNITGTNINLTGVGKLNGATILTA